MGKRQALSPWTRKVSAEIYELTVAAFARVRGAGAWRIARRPSREHQFEALALRMGVGVGVADAETPAPRPSVSSELIADIPEGIREFFGHQPARETISAFVADHSDAALLKLIAEQPRWLGATAVLDRIVFHREMVMQGRAPASRRFLDGLQRALTPNSAHRERRYDDELVAQAYGHAHSASVKIRAAYLELRLDSPHSTIVQLGRRLHDRLKGDDASLDVSMVKSFLAEIGAVVKDRDGRRYVTIEDEGWPRARSIAFLSAYFDLSVSTVRRCLPRARS